MNLLKSALLVITALTLSGQADSAAALPSRPNIVFILTDDQDFDELSCYTGKIPTPHMDSLARDGIRFTRQYSAPLCGPSRFNLLTGRYASRRESLTGRYPVSGPAFITHDDTKILSPEKHTLASVLKAAGYATGMCGKWHQGTIRPVQAIKPTDDPSDPVVAAALQDNYENLRQSVMTWGYDFADGLFLNNRNALNFLPTELRFHNMEWLTNAALDFITRNRSKPFFLFFAPTLVHDTSLESLKADLGCTPRGRIAVSSRMPARSNVLERAAATAAQNRFGLEQNAASIWMDDGIGAILQKLKELNLEENTLVVLVSDNANLAKMALYEGGVRTPCLVRFPGVVPAGVVSDALITHLDFVPTALALAGVKRPADMILDGMNILPALRNDPSYRRESIYLEVAYQRAVVSGNKWKYIANRFPAGYVPGQPGALLWLNVEKNRKQFPAYDDADQLYDLDADPGEQRNLFKDERYRAQRERLKALMNLYSRTLPNRFGEFSQKTNSD